MRFLFAADGFPGAEGTGAGSGIGRYLAESTAGLTARGHECHVLAWGRPGAPSPQDVAGVRVHLLPRGYWPAVERLVPGSRNAAARRTAARRLDATHRFDWVEIQSDEGIDIGIQRDFGPRSILRVHTTLAQMVEHKRVAPTGRARAYLARERRSLLLARRIVVSTAGHAREVRRLFPLRARPEVMPLGFDPPVAPGPPAGGPPPSDRPTFLVVGTLDLRKGSDRLLPALAAYARRSGPCRCVIVTADGPDRRAEFGLDAPPAGVEITWRSGLGDADHYTEFARASAVLHLARYESFGYPPIEAAALSTPVVATAVGAAPDLMAGDLSRFLVDGDDPAAVAAALSEAIGRPGLGAALRSRHEALFSRNRMVAAYLDALAGWAAASSGRRRDESPCLTHDRTQVR